MKPSKHEISTAVFGSNRIRMTGISLPNYGRSTFALLLLCAGCGYYQGDVTRIPVEMPETFSASGKKEMTGKWWKAFCDEKLDATVDKALTGNFSLRMAWDRLMQARMEAVKNGASLLPGLDASAMSKRSLSRKRADTGFDRSYSTDLMLGLSTSYELDLWGRVRATRDASQMEAMASGEELHAAAMTLSAEVARTWYQLVEQHGQLEILDEQVKTNREYLEIIELKFRRGQTSATDVLQQQKLVESTKGERVQVESSIKVLEHQLAVLSGDSPEGSPISVSGDLPELPPMPETGIPMEWLGKRPDVRAAELRVRAADYRLAAALADRFPRISISAGSESSAQKSRDLFRNWLSNLAANLSAPIFDGGLRRAEAEAKKAAASEALNSYGMTILTSLQQVEDAICQEHKQAEYMESLARQLDLSRQTTEQTRENYTKGTMDFTRYLTTLLDYQSLQRSYLRSQRDLVLLRIELYRALGDRWPLALPSGAGCPCNRPITEVLLETENGTFEPYIQAKGEGESYVDK